MSELDNAIKRLKENADKRELPYIIVDIIKKNCSKEVIDLILQNLKECDNSSSSEALECLEEIGFVPLNEVCGYPYQRISKEYAEQFNTIKQALLKAQEQEKVLEIIKEYQVDVWLLKQCDYENYIRIRKEAMVSIGQIVDENGITLEDEITEEYFDLVKRYFK